MSSNEEETTGEEVVSTTPGEEETTGEEVVITASNEDGKILSDASNPPQWPNLYDETKLMLLGSVFIPAMANIRTLARNGKLPEEDAQAVMTMPLVVQTAVQTILKSRDILLAEYPKDIGVPSQIRALEILGEKYVRGKGEFIVYDDETRDKGLVYGMEVNPDKKRIIIAFRGTTTLNDWKTDLNATLTEIDNPLADKDKSQRKQLGVHLGFARYLLAGENGLQKKHGKLGPDYDPDSTKGSKFNAIVGHVRRLLEEHPGCHIYCIGHSLGGALATLTSFFLAAMPEVPAPVSCITFGQPLVGDFRFRQAYVWMEEHGRIRCARVSNSNDVIPLIPLRGGRWIRTFSRLQGNAYHHVGNEIQLCPDEHCLIARPSHKLRDTARLVRNVTVGVQQRSILQHHTIREYAINHKSVKDTLKPMYLDDLYKLKQEELHKKMKAEQQTAEESEAEEELTAEEPKAED